MTLLSLNCILIVCNEDLWLVPDLLNYTHVFISTIVFFHYTLMSFMMFLLARDSFYSHKKRRSKNLENKFSRLNLLLVKSLFKISRDVHWYQNNKCEKPLRFPLIYEREGEQPSLVQSARTTLKNYRLARVMILRFLFQLFEHIIGFL